ncbi:MAG: hypothetical protein M0026_14180 [Nocardiopsaceae bacterium]|nr:hypothetical protein [Nocardiopsaceae bacterium]
MRDNSGQENRPGQERGRGGKNDQDRPLADRRGDGPPPGPDTELAGEREPSESDPPNQEPKDKGDDPPGQPTRA